MLMDPDKRIRLWWIANSQEELDEWLYRDLHAADVSIYEIKRYSETHIDVIFDTTVDFAKTRFGYDNASLAESVLNARQYVQE